MSSVKLEETKKAKAKIPGNGQTVLVSQFSKREPWRPAGCSLFLFLAEGNLKSV